MPVQRQNLCCCQISYNRPTSQSFRRVTNLDRLHIISMNCELSTIQDLFLKNGSRCRPTYVKQTHSYRHRLQYRMQSRADTVQAAGNTFGAYTVVMIL